jgi:hypothetical protein
LIFESAKDAEYNSADMGYKVERKALSTIEFECGRAADGYKYV